MAMRNNPIIINAYAKINWFLDITGIRSDGYHQLSMLMQSIDLHDTLTFEPSESLSFSVDGQDCSDDSANLVIRAAHALNRFCDTNHSAHIELQKRIPSRAGLGGGSADCAATLCTLNKLWRLGLSMDTLMRIGLSLGADVPFCIIGGLAKVSGIGERIESVSNAPLFPLLMVTPGGGLSTGAVFHEWDLDPVFQSTKSPERMADAILKRDFARMQDCSYNALERPATKLLPEIQSVMTDMKNAGAKMVSLSGSGSTVYAVFDNTEVAEVASQSIPNSIITFTHGQNNYL